MPNTVYQSAVLVHLASGVGNIVFATPLLVALNQMQYTVDVLLHADYPQTADLLRDWSVVRAIYHDSSSVLSHRHAYLYVIPAIPPFYWPRFAQLYRRMPRTLDRPSDALFYGNEQDYYLAFARTLGYPKDVSPLYCLPIAPAEQSGVTARTLVIAPGCKTGDMAVKRWPYFPQLTERFDNVVLVGTADDVRRHDATVWHFPRHVRSFLDQLTLRQTAAVLAAAGAVVGNDSGLSHIAAAVGTPTVMLFGPTPHLSLGSSRRMCRYCELAWRVNPAGSARASAPVQPRYTVCSSSQWTPSSTYFGSC